MMGMLLLSLRVLRMRLLVDRRHVLLRPSSARGHFLSSIQSTVSSESEEALARPTGPTEGRIDRSRSAFPQIKQQRRSTTQCSSAFSSSSSSCQGQSAVRNEGAQHNCRPSRMICAPSRSLSRSLESRSPAPSLPPAFSIWTIAREISLPERQTREAEGRVPSSGRSSDSASLDGR